MPSGVGLRDRRNDAAALFVDGANLQTRLGKLDLVVVVAAVDICVEGAADIAAVGAVDCKRDRKRDVEAKGLARIAVIDLKHHVGRG